MAENNLIMWLALSIMFNVVIIGFFTVTGIGNYAFRRFFNRMKIRKGLHVNTLMVTKNGVMKEYFKRVEDNGCFKFKGQSYTRNPILAFNHFGMPTSIHVEGTPDPLNPFDNKEADKISCNEIDTVMLAENTFDLKAWLSRWSPIIFLGVIILVIIVVVCGAFGFMSYQILNDQTFKVSCEVVNNALNATIIKPI